jgi:hypothetical protein
MVKINGQLLDQYFKRYDEINQKPGVIVFIAWLLRALINDNYRDLRKLQRYFLSNRCNSISSLSNIDLPEIEILMVSKREDFIVLRKSLESALSMSFNPVKKISIIVPDLELNTCKEYLIDCVHYNKISFIPEKSVLAPEIFELIHSERPDKFGWILQQVLVASYVINSKSDYILVLDSDTILLRPKVWVDKHSRQLLMPTQELHKPYYDFLCSSSNVYKHPRNSFMSHHLLIQTKIFSEIFGMYNGSVLSALQKAFKFSSKAESSPFDLKYEIYSQYLLIKYPELIELNKWANLSLARSDLTGFESSDVIKYSLTQRYNSVSFHSWND